MPAAIEIDATTGQAAFMSANAPAWHRLGTVTEGAQTPADALRIAHLDRWNVRLFALQTAPILDENGVTPSLSVPDQFAVVRDNPFTTGQIDVLGVVGDRYQCFQNEQLVDFLTSLVEEGGAVIETAGSLGKGEKVFFSMRLPKSVLIGGRDLSNHYLTVLAGHDGNWSVRVLVTTVRVVCGNTWNAALGNNVASFAMRHTASISTRLDQARKVLGVAWKHLSDFDTQCQALVEKELTRDAFNAIVADLWPVNTEAKTSRAATISANRKASLNGLFGGATNEDIRGTALDGLMAITEYLDHNGTDKSRNAFRVATSATVQQTKEAALARLLTV
jgi:phage/plasmid-like protein (TIGR03299 family)